MARTRLDSAAIDAALVELPAWRHVEEKLVREVKFVSFGAAMAFVNRLAAAAEAADHHPDIDIRYDDVRLALVTHDVRGITARDLTMARQIDAMLHVKLP